MTLILFHPGAARIDCDLCKDYLHDMETGKVKTYHSGPERIEKKYERPKGSLPPCDICPKKRPRKSVISWKNFQTFEFYKQVRATRGACLVGRMRTDRLLARNLAIVDGIYRQFERQQLALEIANITVPRHG